MAEAPYARLRVLTVEGPKIIDVHDPTDASRVAQHWNAIRTFLGTGDPTALTDFESESVEGERLETGLAAIEDWDRAGALDFEEIYES